MSRIRSKDTQIELILRSVLWKKGYRFRVHYKCLPGKPDIVFTKKKVAVFIDGDFWHGYNWKRRGKIPPKKYWQKKIQKNIDRDRKYNKGIRGMGWKVIRLWEHEVEKSLERCIKKIEAALLAANAKRNKV